MGFHNEDRAQEEWVSDPEQLEADRRKETRIMIRIIALAVVIVAGFILAACSPPMVSGRLDVPHFAGTWHPELQKLCAATLPSRGAPRVQEVGNAGGSISAAAARMCADLKRGDTFRIVRACGSACTMHLAIPRERLCAESGVLFAFHGGFIPDKSKRGLPGELMASVYPEPLRTWYNKKARGYSFNYVNRKATDLAEQGVIRICD